jgi:hypothetical protein
MQEIISTGLTAALALWALVLLGSLITRAANWHRYWHGK